jgi:hypothetical protein
MEKKPGRPRKRLELLRQSRTATLRSLDRLTRTHVEEIIARQNKIGRLTEEIRQLEETETL